MRGFFVWKKGEIYVLEGERMFRIHDVWQKVFSTEKKKWVWLAFCVTISPDYHLLFD